MSMDNITKISPAKIIKEGTSSVYIFKENDDENNGENKKDKMLPFYHRNSVLRHLTNDWKRYIVLLAPLIFIFIPIMFPNSEGRCGYVIVLMAIFYVTEALPLAVTALMPVFAFPLLGIVSTNQICMVYMRGTAMMFFGGLAVAIAVEHCNLHKRIALFVILKVGQSPRRLMLSFLFTTMFLSMWISNTAATAMMVPILDAILQELYKNHAVKSKLSEEGLSEDRRIAPNMQSQLELVEMSEDHGKRPNGDHIGNGLTHRNTTPAAVPVEATTTTEERLLPPDEESQALSTMYFIATAYGANLGGTGFPTGTGPNLVLWGILQTSFPEGTGLDFATWMLFNIPGMLICAVATWLWLEFVFMGFGRWRKVSKSSKEKEEAVKQLVQRHYDQLGSINFHEITVLILFLILVFLWVLRAPEFITGWAEVVENALSSQVRIGNATPAILIVFLLFVLPSKQPWKNPSGEPIPACLTWKVVHDKVPWGLVLLMGGGFAMAEGASESGLSTVLKLQLQHLQVLPKPVIILLVCTITIFLTEIISNITAASILLPVLKEMALGIRMNPLSLMLPGAICCSYAFMLPVANPPNAIAFNASTMKNSDMMKAGSILNILCILIMTALITTYGVLIFDLNTFPEWAEPQNSTLVL